MNISSDKTDEQLMLGVQNGKEEDFDALYSRYAHRMLAYFYRMLWKEEQKAQDFLQDLFIKILEKADTFHTNRSFKTWIYTLATNMCKNEFRKQDNQQQYVQNLSANSAYLPQHEEEIDAKIYSQQIAKVVKGLEADKKELFILRFKEQLSIEKIAVILKLKEGTVKSRIFYLKKLLVDNLKQFDPKYNE